MDNSFWFYTLSTIPQTLAAMFALIIAMLVYRIEALHKVLERDIAQSKEFLFPIFSELEIDQIEQMSSKAYLLKLKEALNDKLAKNKERLGLSNATYNKLFDIYKRKIDDIHRYYNPNEKRIFNYLLQKKNSIDTHIKIERVISWTFFILTLFTGIVIFLSLYFLPKINLYLLYQQLIIVEVLRYLALFNIFLIVIGVLIMTFTKHFLKLLNVKVN